MMSIGRAGSLLAREIGRYPRYWSRLLRQPSSVRIHGVTLELPRETAPELRALLYAERYERGEARCVLARLEPDDVVLEIGTGIGFISTLCAHLIGSHRVTSYEADPGLIERIRRTYEINAVSPTLVNAMLGDHAGTSEFYVAERFECSSTRRLSSSMRRIIVPQLDVNNEIRKIAATCIIMDVEGGEAELVPSIDWSGIRKLIVELHPAVLGEAKIRELILLLRKRGFVESPLISSTRKKCFERRPARRTERTMPA